MSDTLVERLRDWEHVYPDDYNKDEGHLYDEAADRISDLEAKLAKAVEMALEECPYREDTRSYRDWWSDRRATLAELKADK